LTINCAARGTTQLTLSEISTRLLASARHYHDQGKWQVALLLLMPDHLHGIFSFPRTIKPMTDHVTDWKRFNARTLGIQWQEGFFDHRLRSDEEVTAKFRYIQRNPVVKGLCETPEAWLHQRRPMWPDTKDTADTGRANCPQ
jgi:REP element-mobilizing transposase RayT